MKLSGMFATYSSSFCRRSFVSVSTTIYLNINRRINSSNFNRSSKNGSQSEPSQGQEDGTACEFRTLELYPKKQSGRRGAVMRDPTKRPQPPTTPRFIRLPLSNKEGESMPWSDVWPTAQSFRASVVPLPIRMGYTKSGVPPAKYGNAELMKIPNFLHLTPPAIKKHCQAIKKFCSDWPTGLEKNDHVIERHFPLTVTTYNYCYSGPTIRNPAARLVSIQIRLSSIELDEHAKDKLLRLVGDRYDLKTNTLTLVADRCPMRKQNYDYVIYLLTALFHESWKIESWESEKELLDMEHYVWDGSQSQSSIFRIIGAMSGNVDDVELKSTLKEPLEVFGKAVTTIHNQGEDEHRLNLYKASVKRLLNLQTINNDNDLIGDNASDSILVN